MCPYLGPPLSATQSTATDKKWRNPLCFNVMLSHTQVLEGLVVSVALFCHHLLCARVNTDVYLPPNFCDHVDSLETLNYNVPTMHVVQADFKEL